MSEQFQMQVSSVFHMPGRGTVVAGKVDAGQILVGDNILLVSPRASLSTKVIGLERARQSIGIAEKGEEIAILLPALDMGKLSDGYSIRKEGSTEVMDVIDLQVHTTSGGKNPWLDRIPLLLPIVALPLSHFLQSHFGLSRIYFYGLFILLAVFLFVVAMSLKRRARGL